MSNWTHVAGVIRCDDLRDKYNIVTPNFDKIIGKEIYYSDSLEAWCYARKYPEKYLPLGSENSLQKTVWINPNTSSLAAYTVTIFGDLRDHESSDEIIDWFKKKCEVLNVHYYVRNAVVVAENEHNGTKTWTWEQE